MSTSVREWTPTLTEREIVLFDLKGYILFPAFTLARTPSVF